MAIDNQIAECGTRQKVRPGLILVLSAIAYVSGTTACAASGANPERGVPDPGLPNSGLSDGGPPDTGLPSYFHVIGSMSTARSEYTATLLANGKVLVAGGVGSGGLALASAELYEPATGTFSPTGTMTTAREGHTATMLFNGKVFVAGGDNCDCPFGGCYGFASAELYDPATRSFGSTASMATARAGLTATLVPKESVLVTGGYDCLSDCCIGGSVLASAELYDPATGTFSAIGSMAAERYGHTATLLPSGSVLIAGGSGSTGTLASAELFDRRWLRSGLSRVPGRGSIYDDDN